MGNKIAHHYTTNDVQFICRYTLNIVKNSSSVILLSVVGWNFSALNALTQFAPYSKVACGARIYMNQWDQLHLPEVMLVTLYTNEHCAVIIIIWFYATFNEPPISLGSILVFQDSFSTSSTLSLNLNSFLYFFVFALWGPSLSSLALMLWVYMYLHVEII